MQVLTLPFGIIIPLIRENIPHLEFQDSSAESLVEIMDGILEDVGTTSEDATSFSVYPHD